MSVNTCVPIIEELRCEFQKIVEREGIADKEISIVAKPLTPEEAIGRTSRKDYPLIVGKERLIEARYGDSIGHAFTDLPGDFSATVGQLLEMETRDNGKRAFFVAAVNAVFRHLHPSTKTAHCRNEDPELCGALIAKDLSERYGKARIGVVGLNPAILENLATTFGPENVLAVDLNPQTIGQSKFGVRIQDGRKDLEALIGRSDVVLATGTTLGNGTIDDIFYGTQKLEKPCIFYGVTISAAACLLDLERMCPYAT